MVSIKGRKINIVRLFLLSIVIITILFIFRINGIVFLPCVFHEITGLYCPGCGMTRAIICFFNLDFIGCFRNNLLLIPFVFLILYYIIIIFKLLLNHKGLISITSVYPKWFIIIILIVVIGFGIIRNFDCFKFIQPL